MNSGKSSVVVSKIMEENKQKYILPPAADKNHSRLSENITSNQILTTVDFPHTSLRKRECLG